MTIERLAEIFLEQQGRGANNINLVTPTHFAPQIVEAIKMARSQGLLLPVVCNTSGYEGAEALACLDGFIDIYLVDFKYASQKLAQRYSQAPDYPVVASAALDEMFRQVGAYEEDEVTGLAKKGMIVRHLLLPSCLSDSFAVMRLLAAKPYVRDIVVSLMSQYTPMSGLEGFPELSRPVDPDDYDALINYALALGIENSFCQEGEVASESFIPAFDYEGV